LGGAPFGFHFSKGAAFDFAFFFFVLPTARTVESAPLPFNL
jgi:hypothetical protein